MLIYGNGFTTLKHSNKSAAASVFSSSLQRKWRKELVECQVSSVVEIESM